MQKLFIPLFFFSFLLLFLLNFFRPVTAINEDLGRHLLLGKIILETATIPTTNLLSYTNLNYPFINSHWGSEVLFYSIHTFFGFHGLIIFATGIALASVTFILCFVRKNYSAIAIILASCLYLPLLFERTDIRPEVFSYLLLSFFITTLYTYRSRYSKKILVLIPLQILWVNLHIYFFMGLVIILFFLIDQLLISKFHYTKSVKLLLLTLLLASIGSLFNPHGIHGAIFPLTVFQNYAFPVVENQNMFTLLTFYQQPTIFYFIATMIILFSSLAINFRKTKPIDWLLAITFSVAAIYVFRTIALFAVATFIPFVTALSLVITQSSNYTKKYVGKKYFFILKNYFLFILLLLVFAQIAQTISTKQSGLGVIEYGKQAADFFIRNNISGPIYNNFDIGSYLSYRLYPQKIFVDGRPEAYPKTFFEKTYMPMQENRNEFRNVDDMYSFNALFISHWNQTPWKNIFLQQVINDKRYQLVFLDDYAMILVKKSATNKKIIAEYTINEKSFHIPNTLDAEVLIRYLYFFEKVGWVDKKNEVNEKLKKIDPENKTLNRYQSALQK